jgi:hypothetical protein
MEVLLKKVKITKSVIQQSLMGDRGLYLGHPNYEILGWCYFIHGKNSRRYILLYDKADNVIIKLHFITEGDIEIFSKTEQVRKPGSTYDDWIFPMFHSLKVLPEVNRSNPITIKKSEDIEEVKEAEKKLKAFLREVYQKGQIYI